MNDHNLIEFLGRDGISDPLTQLLRTGAQKLLEEAIKAEVEELLSAFSHQKTEDGKAAVVRNGYHPARQIETGIGPVSVKIPRFVPKRASRSLSIQALCRLMSANQNLLKPPFRGFI